MPDRIIHLPPQVFNQIAAGEVIERPASVVKELLENSIDAESKHITIRISGGGVNKIYVADDGIGMSSRDAICAFDRHATSKISKKEDLFNIHTLGFRGEALSSIGSVAKVNLRTRERGSDTGTFVRIEGGKVIHHREAGCPEGTEIEVNELFYNVPARRKFLKSMNTELGHIINVVKHYALAYKDLHLSLYINDRGGSKLDFPPVKDLKERLYQVYGKDRSKELIKLSFKEGDYLVYGYISSPLLTFTNRENQIFFVNKRVIKNQTISHAIQKAYSDLISRDKYPFVIIFIEVKPSLIDVNVHPTKREIKFRDNNYVYNLLVRAIRKCLIQEGTKNFVFRENPLTTYSSRPGREEVSSYPAEMVQEAFISYREPHPHIEILTCLNQLFILAMIDNELTIVDQHAAHERIVYDKFIKMSQDVDSHIQKLLFPEIVSFTHDRSFLFRECIPYLKGIGFDIEEIGHRSFMIRSIPVLFKGYNLQHIFEDMLEELTAHGIEVSNGSHTLTMEKILNAIVSKKACTKAVKSGDTLSNMEMKALLRDLLSTDMPYTCPHGRPTMKKFSMEDLEKIFKRK